MGDNRTSPYSGVSFLFAYVIGKEIVRKELDPKAGMLRGFCFMG